MRTVSIRKAKNQLAASARRVEKGETIVVTRAGRPILELVPYRRKNGLRLDAITAFKRRHGIRSVVTRIADDFDAPLYQDFLLQPQPNPAI